MFSVKSLLGLKDGSGKGKKKRLLLSETREEKRGGWPSRCASKSIENVYVEYAARALNVASYHLADERNGGDVDAYRSRPQSESIRRGGEEQGHRLRRFGRGRSYGNAGGAEARLQRSKVSLPWCIHTYIYINVVYVCMFTFKTLAIENASSARAWLRVGAALPLPSLST